MINQHSDSGLPSPLNRSGCRLPMAAVYPAAGRSRVLRIEHAERFLKFQLCLCRHTGSRRLRCGWWNGSSYCYSGQPTRQRLRFGHGRRHRRCHRRSRSGTAENNVRQRCSGRQMMGVPAEPGGQRKSAVPRLIHELPIEGGRLLEHMCCICIRRAPAQKGGRSEPVQGTPPTRTADPEVRRCAQCLSVSCLYNPRVEECGNQSQGQPDCRRSHPAYTFSYPVREFVGAHFVDKQNVAALLRPHVGRFPAKCGRGAVHPQVWDFGASLPERRNLLPLGKLVPKRMGLLPRRRRHLLFWRRLLLPIGHQMHCKRYCRRLHLLLLG